MVEAFAEAVDAARRSLPEEHRAGARLVFTAHSIPSAADANAGPPADGGHLYSRQVAEASRLVAAASGSTEYDLVWQSRSGPPQVPWLDPDICDHLEALSEKSVDAVIVCPIGFVSDHLEVVWDLDTEAEEKARELGMAFARAGTPGSDARFPKMIRSWWTSIASAGRAEDSAAFPATDPPSTAIDVPSDVASSRRVHRGLRRHLPDWRLLPDGWPLACLAAQPRQDRYVSVLSVIGPTASRHRCSSPRRWSGPCARRPTAAGRVLLGRPLRQQSVPPREPIRRRR